MLLTCHKPVQGGLWGQETLGQRQTSTSSWSRWDTDSVSVRGAEGSSQHQQASVQGSLQTFRLLKRWQRIPRALTLASFVPSAEASSTCLSSPACAKAGVKAGKRCELLTGMPPHRARLPRICLSIMERSARFRSPPLSSAGVSSGNSATVFCRVVQIVLYLLSCQVQCHKQ